MKVDLPWFGGLYNEVVAADCYNLKGLDFVPDVILDVGANIGLFAHHARSLFYNAELICVEPDDSNFAHLSESPPLGARLIKAAIGNGEIWEIEGIEHGCHRRFISPGVAYPETSQWKKREDLEVLTIAELISRFVKANQKSILKIDIEGNEDAIFAHQPSMEAMLRIDYVAIEVHRFAAGEEQAKELNLETEKALATFFDTHRIVWTQSNFLARKI